MTKEVAQSLKDLHATDTMAGILDRAHDPKDEITLLKSHWGYDLYTRKPGAAFMENGVFTPTDLDLACFMAALADRNAVINLPRYESRRPKTTRPDEMVVSAANRHGQVLGLTPNKEVFSMSVRIKDANVMKQDTDGKGEVGAYRNFMLVDIDGEWHDGWGKIEFLPTAKENAFLTDKKLWTGNTVYFQNFVHPNRWQSFFGKWYFMTRALIQRLEEEASYLRATLKEIVAVEERAEAIVGSQSPPRPKATTEQGKSVKVTAMEVEVDIPLTGDFKPVRANTDAIQVAKDKLRKIQYEDLPTLRFAARSTELACHKSEHFNSGKMPSWIKGAEWTLGYGEAGKRKKWNRLVVAQPIVGQTGYAIRFRKYDKSETVAL